MPNKKAKVAATSDNQVDEDRGSPFDAFKGLVKSIISVPKDELKALKKKRAGEAHRTPPA